MIQQRATKPTRRRNCVDTKERQIHGRIIKTRMKFPSPGHQPLFNYKEMWPGEWNFIKTTYDISLDSQISLLPFGFSLQLWESRYLLILSYGRFLSEFSFLGNDPKDQKYSWPTTILSLSSFSYLWSITVSSLGPQINERSLVNYPGNRNFIKTTYDISLDSQISLLPLGFSLQLWESRY